MTDLYDQACQSAVARHPAQPRSAEEKFARVMTQLAQVESHRPLACSGKIYIGMFFDGTGNNKKLDYDDVPDVTKQKHSNVVRLFHVYPDNIRDATDAYFRYYAPGVGTPFEDIGDFGGGLGKGFAAMGQARILWGLTRVFNSVSRYLYQGDLISAETAKHLSLERLTMGADLKGYWQPRLRQKIAEYKSRPTIDRIVIDVFGFSRGAAQARAWVRHLYALCEKSGDDYLFAGRPLQVRFMGLFDTVASVGSAGLLAGSLLDLEGHMSWADKALQIPPQVGHCLHYVALHEVRGCFASDSVRVDHVYPANCREVVYPGAHSDVGGGYRPDAQGKTDQLARVPGFAMYEAARDRGVPFFSPQQIKIKFEPVWQALTPSVEATRAFTAYQQAAGIGDLPLLEAHRSHMALYFRYRMQAGLHYGERPFMLKLHKQSLITDLDVRAARQAEQRALVKTQRDLLELARTVALMARYDDQRRGSRTLSLAGANAALQRWKYYETSLPSSARPQPLALNRALAMWRERLGAEPSAELLTEVPDLDLLRVADALCGAHVAPNIEAFFDDYVHDSMAGFINDGVDEYDLNNLGLFKHRRFYFGDAGDAHERRRVRDENNRRKAALTRPVATPAAGPATGRPS